MDTICYLDQSVGLTVASERPVDFQRNLNSSGDILFTVNLVRKTLFCISHNIIRAIAMAILLVERRQGIQVTYQSLDKLKIVLGSSSCVVVF